MVVKKKKVVNENKVINKKTVVKKKKAQTALEILVIFGVLVMGAIIFALFYSNNIRSNVETSSNIHGIYSDIESQLQSEDSQQPIGACGDGFCGLGENCDTCPEDCECIDFACPKSPPDISLFVEPSTGVPAGAPGHNTFDLVISVADLPSGYIDREIIIKKLIINEGYTDAFYQGQNQISTEGLVINKKKNMGEREFMYTISNLSSKKSGSYNFRILAEVPGCNIGFDSSNGSTEVIIKGLSAILSLSPDGASNTGNEFGVDIGVRSYNSDEDINITKIYVADINSVLVNNVCAYRGVNIPKSGTCVNLQLKKNNDDYSYSFDDDFVCSVPGQYKFIFTLHDNKENIDFDYNATIEKSIYDRCLYLGNKGDGTILRPYIISNPEDLDCVRYNLSKHFMLGGDIDLNHEVLSAKKEYYWYDDVYGWLPIGTKDAPFTGSFNGNYYTIYNLYTRRNNNVSGGGAVTPILFKGDIYNSLFLNTSGAKFNNLNLLDVDINGWHSGSLVYYSNDSNFNNINVNGNIVSNFFGGGLVSFAKDSNFEKCSFEGNLNVNLYGGGLIGSAKNIVINNSTTNGNIIGRSYIGGLVGDISKDYNNLKASLISRSVSCGNISARNYVGGLLGYTNTAIITDSHSEVDISDGHLRVGGLCGNCRSIINSYATGDINTWGGENFQSDPSYYASGIGGLAGSVSDGNIINSYATGDITLVPQDNNMSLRVGGLIGYAVLGYVPSMDIVNSYARGNILIDGPAQHVGGLLGQSMGAQVHNSYSTGNINISGDETYVGGLIGDVFYFERRPDAPTYIQDPTGVYSTHSCYWNTETSGQSTSHGGFGRYTDDMTFEYDSNTFISWDFVNVWAHDVDYNENDGYPYLLQNPHLEKTSDKLENVGSSGSFYPLILVSENGEIIETSNN